MHMPQVIIMSHAFERNGRVHFHAIRSLEGKKTLRDQAVSIDAFKDCVRPEVCPALAGKPKIFIGVGCRGDNDPVATEVSVMQTDAPMMETDAPDGSSSVSADNDFYFLYSTTSGTTSLRDPNEGTLLCRVLCKKVSVRKHFLSGPSS